MKLQLSRKDFATLCLIHRETIRTIGQLSFVTMKVKALVADVDDAMLQANEALAALDGFMGNVLVDGE